LRKNNEGKITRSVVWSPFVDKMAVKYTDNDIEFSSISNMAETAMLLLISKLEFGESISAVDCIEKQK
jgi:hypothetical protein